MRLWRAIRRWWKCRVLGLHYFRFVRKAPDGSRLLRCVRCPAQRRTPRRRRKGFQP